MRPSEPHAPATAAGTGPRVLIVDGEPQIRRALRLNLCARNFEVLEAHTAQAGIALASSERPDVVLVELELPVVDGFAVIDALRGWTNVPIVVLSTRDDEHSKVRALRAGADDYVTKPFGMGEVLARLDAVLRRSSAALPESPNVVTSAFRLDLAGHRTYVGAIQTETRLTRTEWGIVGHLARHPRRLVTYPQLRTAVWGAFARSDDNLLRVHMSHIRRKLEPSPAKPRFYVTDSGAGNRFEPAA